MALRPRESPNSMNSRYGSQALAEGLRAGLRFVVTAIVPADPAAGVGDHSHWPVLPATPSPPPGGRTAMPAASDIRRRLSPNPCRRFECAAATIPAVPAR